MENTRSNVRTVIVLVGGTVVIAVLVFILQLPSLSIRGLIVGERIVAGGQFWLLELTAGALTSGIITGVTVLLFRRLVLWVGVTSVVMQLAWMAFTQSFATPVGSFADIAFRSAEFVGIVVGAVIAVLVARGILSGRG
jgi:hypothetical protein